MFSLAVARTATESSIKKWEMHCNGILFHWLDRESGTEICMTP